MKQNYSEIYDIIGKIKGSSNSWLALDKRFGIIRYIKVYNDIFKNNEDCELLVRHIKICELLHTYHVLETDYESELENKNNYYKNGKYSLINSNDKCRKRSRSFCQKLKKDLNQEFDIKKQKIPYFQKLLKNSLNYNKIFEILTNENDEKNIFSLNKFDIAVVSEFENFSLKQFINIIHSPNYSNSYEKRKLLDFICYQLIFSINNLHKINILHNSLTTDTIFIDKNAIVKISNFSFSTIINHEKINLRDYNSSRCYKSPEIIFSDNLSIKYNNSKSESIIKFSSDIWSLGCILYEIFYLKKLFSCNNTIEHMISILNVKKLFHNHVQEANSNNLININENGNGNTIMNFGISNEDIKSIPLAEGFIINIQQLLISDGINKKEISNILEKIKNDEESKKENNEIEIEYKTYKSEFLDNIDNIISSMLEFNPLKRISINSIFKYFSNEIKDSFNDLLIKDNEYNNNNFQNYLYNYSREKNIDENLNFVSIIPIDDVIISDNIFDLTKKFNHYQTIVKLDLNIDLNYDGSLLIENNIIKRQISFNNIISNIRNYNKVISFKEKVLLNVD